MIILVNKGACKHYSILMYFGPESYLILINKIICVQIRVSRERTDRSDIDLIRKCCERLNLDISHLFRRNDIYRKAFV